MTQTVQAPTVTVQTPPYTLSPDEKVARVMAYTSNALVWGDVVVKEMIRVSTWLRTNNAPDRVRIYSARMVNTTASSQVKPLHFSEVYIATSQINVFHLMPPAQDPVDYDPTEPNRKMEPVTMMVSNFRIDGHLRLAVSGSVGKFLEVVRENFTSVYDAQISCPTNPGFKTITVPYVIVRQEATAFGIE
jgi:hypothetical protein